MKKMLAERYMVHDELLFELYNLKPDTITYELIDGVPYLVNAAKQRTFQIGFRVMLNKKLDDFVPSGTTLDMIDALYNEYTLFSIKKELLQYSERLCLSNFEKYMMNVLLDKNLDSYKISTINLKEIEIEYRSMAMSRRYITLNNETYERYLKAIDSLYRKELFIKTTSTFRKSCYGVNDINAVQRLINISDYCFDGSHNLEISYSFGILGDILHNCKRFSTLAPSKCFKVNINQVKLNLVAMYIARQLYIERGIRRKSIEPHFMFQLDVDKIIRFVDDPLEPISSNYNRQRRYIEKLIAKILCSMEKEGTIYEFLIDDKKTKDISKSKEEEEREAYFQELNEYWGEKESKIKETTYKSFTIYISEPTWERQVEDMMNSAD